MDRRCAECHSGSGPSSTGHRMPASDAIHTRVLPMQMVSRFGKLAQRLIFANGCPLLAKRPRLLAFFTLGLNIGVPCGNSA
jgi:hypothetical protein